MKKDWKFWVAMFCVGAALVMCVIQKDLTCGLWVLGSGLAYFGFRVVLQEYDKLKSAIKHSDRIINLQSEMIKELENKINNI